MANERTEAIRIHHELVTAIRPQDAFLADAVQNAVECRLENGILYLRYPQPYVNNMNARMLKDSERKPILDQAASAMGIKVLLE